VATRSMEDRVTILEKDNKMLKHELERTKAFNEILNITHLAQWYHTANRDYAIGTLMATKDPSTRTYWGNAGWWEGPENVQKSTKIFAPGYFPKGHMPIHLMANPIIEVAGDGKTAKAVFVAAGVTAMKDRKTGKPRAGWEWNRYGIDYIKEDGKWKLWHWHIFDLFGVGWDDKWEDQFKPRERGGANFPDELKPDHPPTPLDVAYNPDGELPYLPPPEPYETFDPKTMY
jgi:hypothetical protein